MRFYLVLAVSVVLHSTLSAQKSVKDSVQLDELVVTGSKKEISRKLVPLSVSQVTQTEIENSGQMNILPALNFYAPDVFVTQRNILGFGVSTGGSGSVTIRGISGSPNTDILVLIDGHPQYQGLFGHPLPDAYVASDVEKVEIIRGPGSLLYGSNAMAGVINIITKKQKKDGFSGTMGAAYGSYNTQKFYETTGYKKGKFSIFSSANHDQTDGIRTNTGFNISNGYLKAGYEWNNHFQLTGDVSIAGFTANDNGPVTAAPAPFSIDITRGSTQVTLADHFDASEGALKVYHNFGEHTLSDGFHSTDRNSGIMLYQSFRLWKGNTLTAGTDLAQYGGISNQGMLHDSLLLMNEMAVYAYMQQTLMEKLTLSAGLRVDYNPVFGTELVPLGGLSYNPTSNTTLKASVSKGFRNPTLMELYLFMPNPALKPENLINYELSWLQSLLNNQLTTELTIYREDASNIIEVVGVNQSLQRMNSGAFSNEGVEFSAHYAVSRHLSLNANYSYLHLGQPVIAAPRQQANLSAFYIRGKCSLNVSAQYIDHLYTQLATTPGTTAVIEPGYFLLNARFAYHPFAKLELFAEGNNLLNSQYEINYGYPMPGINFNAGLNVRF